MNWFLSEFEFDIEHIKWKQITIANDIRKHSHALMRVYVSVVSTYFMEQIKKSIYEDHNYQQIQQKKKQE